MPNTLGSTTRVVFLEAPEPGKLHIEFEAAAALKKGQQVKLDSTGKIVALGAGESLFLCIGVLVQDVANGERATVACRGYCMVIARAAGAITPGPVKIAAYDTANNRPVYADADGIDNTAKTVETVGHNIDDLAAAGENKVILL